MGRYTRMFLMAVAIFFGLAGSASATTYYIATNGSDSNSGTSQSSPWAHLPGMATWTGSHTPVAGDTFILRGCDHWTNASFPITWSWSGTSSSPITIDRDTTWYNTTNCPNGWNRAVWDAQGAAIQAPECTSGHKNFFLSMSGSAQYVDFDWIEAYNYFWNSDQQGACWSEGGFVSMGTSDYVTLDNWYVHDWNYGASATDNDHMFTVSSGGHCGHCVLENSVLDNSDASAHNSGVGVQFSSVNNVFYGMVNALKPYYVQTGQYVGNNISGVGMSFDGKTHPNCIETITGTLYYFVSNYIHGNSVCEGLQVGNPGETDYVMNNVWIVGGAGNNGPQVPQSETPASMYFMNNTVVGCGGCIQNAGHGYSWSGTFVSENNLCINSGGSNSSGSPTAGLVTIGNNIGLTTSAASSQGYSSSGTFPYAPTSSNCNGISLNCAISAGLDLTSVWPTSVFAATDLTVLCNEQTVSGVVESVCTTRGNPRGLAWDAGAYQFSSSSVSGQPAAPTGLTAAVQ